MFKKIWPTTSILIIVSLILVWRTWFRISDPQVWSEDGNQNLFNLLEYGYHSIFFPVNGYLIIIPKIISALSLFISLYYYPQISIYITFAFTIYIAYEIYRSRIMLSGKVFMALFTLLIPTDTECFGLPLYTFWWASLLIFLCMLWSDENTNIIKRAIWILMAGLSSPIIIISLPVFFYRIIKFTNRRTELMLTALASLCAGIQLLVMHFNVNVENQSHNSPLSSLPQILQKYIGQYFYGNHLKEVSSDSLMVISFFFLASLIFFIIKQKDKAPVIILTYLFLASIFISIIRVDISFQHPVYAGQRYFFFPYILISWLLLQMLFSGKRLYLLQIVSLCGLAAGVYNMLPVQNRNHEHIDWQANILSCAKFKMYDIPIHSDGRTQHMWNVPVKGSECAYRLKNDLLRPPKNIATNTFPYRWTQNFKFRDVTAKRAQMVDIQWLGKDFYNSKITGLEVFGSYMTGNDDIASQQLNLTRGDKILFRSDSSKGTQEIIIDGMEDDFTHKLPNREGWILLDFSSEDLPDNFLITFRDNGRDAGDWSAIALR